jgi:hypothetical protein
MKRGPTERGDGRQAGPAEREKRQQAAALQRRLGTKFGEGTEPGFGGQCFDAGLASNRAREGIKGWSAPPKAWSRGLRWPQGPPLPVSRARRRLKLAPGSLPLLLAGCSYHRLVVGE